MYDILNTHRHIRTHTHTHSETDLDLRSAVRFFVFKKKNKFNLSVSNIKTSIQFFKPKDPTQLSCKCHPSIMSIYIYQAVGREKKGGEFVGQLRCKLVV